MTKVSVVFYYWILIAATLLFTRTAGLAENNSAVIKILIVVTILYIGVVMISLSLGKKRVEERGVNGARGRNSKKSGSGSGAKGKKKK